jgi:hypothetical protein
MSKPKCVFASLCAHCYETFVISHGEFSEISDHLQTAKLKAASSDAKLDSFFKHE